MKIIVTTKSFGEGFTDFDGFLPFLPQIMEQTISMLALLERPEINIDKLVAVHITDDYRKELFDFQESIGQAKFYTHNKIGEGKGQVITVEDGFHIFFDKQVLVPIIAAQIFENNQLQIDNKIKASLAIEKNKYLRMVRHELAHVEDLTNQQKWNWAMGFGVSNNIKDNLQYIALRLWEEYYACQRSNFMNNIEMLEDELSSLLSNLTVAEEEICKQRWKYNIREISLKDFLKTLFEYIKMAFVYCCYFMGHYNKHSDTLEPFFVQGSYLSRFYSFIPSMWECLKIMHESYPNWNTMEIFNGLSDILLCSIRSFEVYPEDTTEGTYYSIPPKELITRKQEYLEKQK